MSHCECSRAPKNDPAAQETGIELVIGKVSDPKTLHRFLQGLDAVGFESELVDISLLKNTQAKFVPDLPVMALLSEKLEQKKLLFRLGIPTAPFEVAPTQDFKPWLLDLRKRWGALVLQMVEVRLRRPRALFSSKKARIFPTLNKF